MHIFTVTGNKTVTGGDANTEVAFKNCAPFTTCVTHIVLTGNKTVTGGDINT